MGKTTTAGLIGLLLETQFRSVAGEPTYQLDVQELSFEEDGRSSTRLFVERLSDSSLKREALALLRAAIALFSDETTSCDVQSTTFVLMFDGGNVGIQCSLSVGWPTTTLTFVDGLLFRRPLRPEAADRLFTVKSGRSQRALRFRALGAVPRVNNETLTQSLTSLRSDSSNDLQSEFEALAALLRDVSARVLRGRGDNFMLVGVDMNDPIDDLNVSQRRSRPSEAVCIDATYSNGVGLGDWLEYLTPWFLAEGRTAEFLLIDAIDDLNVSLRRSRPSEAVCIDATYSNGVGLGEWLDYLTPWFLAEGRTAEFLLNDPIDDLNVSLRRSRPWEAVCIDAIYYSYGVGLGDWLDQLTGRSIAQDRTVAFLAMTQAAQLADENWSTGRADGDLAWNESVCEYAREGFGRNAELSNASRLGAWLVQLTQFMTERRPLARVRRSARGGWAIGTAAALERGLRLADLGPTHTWVTCDVPLSRDLSGSEGVSSSNDRPRTHRVARGRLAQRAIDHRFGVHSSRVNERTCAQRCPSTCRFMATSREEALCPRH
jgi:hypothetical protein